MIPNLTLARFRGVPLVAPCGSPRFRAPTLEATIGSADLVLVASADTGRAVIIYHRSSTVIDSHASSWSVAWAVVVSLLMSLLSLPSSMLWQRVVRQFVLFDVVHYTRHRRASWPSATSCRSENEQQAVLTQHLTLRDVQVGGRGFRLDNRGLCLPAHRHACVPSSWVHSYQSSLLVVTTPRDRRNRYGREDGDEEFS